MFKVIVVIFLATNFFLLPQLNAGLVIYRQLHLPHSFVYAILRQPLTKFCPTFFFQHKKKNYSKLPEVGAQTLHALFVNTIFSTQSKSADTKPDVPISIFAEKNTSGRTFYVTSVFIYYSIFSVILILHRPRTLTLFYKRTSDVS